MRIYIAGPWSERDSIRRLADQFVAAGHDITECWWDHEALDPEGFAHEATRDLAGVKSADYFVLINSQLRGQETSGKAVETGYALAYGIPVLMVGTPSNVFHHHPDVHQYNTFSDVLNDLNAPPHGGRISY